AKRGLVLVNGSGLREGDNLIDSAGAAVATVACTDAPGRLALAVANLESVDESTTRDGLPVERLPLSGGLQRPT
ncbi:MAG: hypothetical protein ACREO3_06535, partial [Arenimonas sp.]